MSCTLCTRRLGSAAACRVHYPAELKAQEGYNARERRALAAKGGTDTVPMPSWMTGSQAAGRGGSKSTQEAPDDMHPIAVRF